MTFKLPYNQIYQMKAPNIISQKYFQVYPTVHAHLKTDNVDYQKKKSFFIFAIYSSSRHEKCCQMSVRLFSLFQGSLETNSEVFKYLNNIKLNLKWKH